MFVLAGDVGGTNSRLVCAEVNGTNRSIIAEQQYHSADYHYLVDVISQFLSDHDISDKITAACIAVAGPVQSGVSSVTNLPWTISETGLSQALGIPRVKLINDFIAVVYGVDELDESGFLILQQGKESGRKNNRPDAAIIGAGTGLGIAHRAWLGEQYHAFSSEAGHAGFAPATEQQTRLLAWLLEKHPHVSLEMLLSGRGLYTIYRFLKEEEQHPVQAVVEDSIRNNDPAKVITECALSGKDELCSQALDCFIDIYGAAAGDAGLYYYPVDEVYIAGGIASKIRDKIAGPRFIDAFNNKDKMSENMRNLTVKLITDEGVGLLGALSLANKMCF